MSYPLPELNQINERSYRKIPLICPELVLGGPVNGIAHVGDGRVYKQHAMPFGNELIRNDSMKDL